MQRLRKISFIQNFGPIDVWPIVQSERLSLHKLLNWVLFPWPKFLGFCGGFLKLPFATWNPSSHTQESTAMQFPKQQMSPNLILKLSVDPVFLFWGKNYQFFLWWKFEGVLFMHLFHTINHIRYYSAQHVTSWGHPLASARAIKAITRRGLKRASESWHHHFSNWIEGTLGLGF